LIFSRAFHARKDATPLWLLLFGLVTNDLANNFNIWPLTFIFSCSRAPVIVAEKELWRSKVKRGVIFFVLPKRCRLYSLATVLCSIADNEIDVWMVRSSAERPTEHSDRCVKYFETTSLARSMRMSKLLKINYIKQRPAMMEPLEGQHFCHTSISLESGHRCSRRRLFELSTTRQKVVACRYKLV